jgi:Arc/MetJ family transcription regulator
MPYSGYVWGQVIVMARTTVIIDDRLLDEAMKASGARTKRQAITAGLNELIRREFGGSTSGAGHIGFSPFLRGTAEAER